RWSLVISGCGRAAGDWAQRRVRVAAYRRFLKIANDLTAEYGQIARQPRRDDIAVAHYGLVDVVTAGINYVVLDNRHARHPSAFGNPGRGQYPSSVADRGHEAALVVYLTHEIYHLRAATHPLRG